MFWTDLLICPACQARLDDTARCGCGETFDSDEGTPRLIAAQPRRELKIDYTGTRSTKDAELLSRVLREPPVPRQTGLPYHLDPAHAAALSELPAGSRVLEIGCGGGQNRPWMRERGLEYVGVDYSKTRVFEWLQEFGGADLLCDAHFLPFADDSFDAVYTAAVFEHLANPMVAAAEVRRVLKPGGVFLGTVAFLEPWHDDSFFHMSPLGTLELLISHGFDVDSLWPGERYWTAFYSVPQMAGRGPFKWLRVVGRLWNGLYLLQHGALNLARRLTGKRRVDSIVPRSTIAGSIYWIARTSP